MEAIDLLALIATLCGAVTFLPQTIKVVQRKKRGTLNLSVIPFRFYTAGAALWMVFTILEKSINYPLLAANSMVIILNVPILYHLSRFSHATVLTYIFLAICGIFVAVAFRLIMGSIDAKIFTFFSSMIAGAFTGLAFIGQMIKSIRIRRTENIALTFSFMMIFQSLLWIIYWAVKSTVYHDDVELWIAGMLWTVVEILIMVPIFVFKVVYRIQLRKAPQIEQTVTSYTSIYDKFFKG